jgi:hypothetical protein
VEHLAHSALREPEAQALAADTPPARRRCVERLAPEDDIAHRDILTAATQLPQMSSTGLWTTVDYSLIATYSLISARGDDNAVRGLPPRP